METDACKVCKRWILILAMLAVARSNLPDGLGNLKIVIGRQLQPITTAEFGSGQLGGVETEEMVGTTAVLPVTLVKNKFYAESIINLNLNISQYR